GGGRQGRPDSSADRRQRRLLGGGDGEARPVGRIDGGNLGAIRGHRGCHCRRLDGNLGRRPGESGFRAVMRRSASLTCSGVADCSCKSLSSRDGFPPDFYVMAALGVVAFLLVVEHGSSDNLGTVWT